MFIFKLYIRYAEHSIAYRENGRYWECVWNLDDPYELEAWAIGDTRINGYFIGGLTPRFGDRFSYDTMIGRLFYESLDRGWR